MPPMSAPAPVVFPNSVNEIEQVCHHPCRLYRPVPMPHGAQSNVPPAAAWPNLTTTPSGNGGPTWRWYGWGAANTPGAEKAFPASEGLNVLPPPSPNIELPKSMPAKQMSVPNEGMNRQPNWNTPVRAPEYSMPVNNDPPAPTLTPPNLDMQFQSPRPAMKPNSSPSVDPWTGVGPMSKANGTRPDIVACSNWTVARASGSR